MMKCGRPSFFLETLPPILIGVWLLSLAVYLLALGIASGPFNWQYFTVWCLTLQCAFYALVVVAHFNQPLKTVFFLIALTWIHGVVWMVSVLATLIMFLNPNGAWIRGQNRGIVVLNQIYSHYLPTIIFVGFVIWHRDFIHRLYRSAHLRLNRWWLQAPYAAAQIALLPGLWLLVYLLNFDVQRVYGIEWPNWAFGLLGWAAAVVANCLFYAPTILPEEEEEEDRLRAAAREGGAQAPYVHWRRRGLALSEPQQTTVATAITTTPAVTAGNRSPTAKQNQPITTDV